MNGLIKTFYSTNKVKFSLKNPALEVSTIRVRTNINGERFSYYLPSKYKLNRSCWDSEAGRAIEDVKKNPQLKGNPQLQLIMRNINKEIEKTQNALIMILELCQAHGVTPTLEQVRTELRKELLGEQPEEKEEEKESKPLVTDFFELANYYIELCENQSILNQKGEKFAKGSIYNHKAALKIVKEFCEYANIKKLSLEDVDVYFYAAFLKYMTTEAEHDRGKYKTNGIGKIIKSIKVFARFAHENGYTLNDSYRKFKVFREEVETVYLNETELTALYNLKLPENLAQVRDAFLVSCYTGLRYGDMARLEQKHFHDSTGTIEIDTQKTKERVVIPIHPKVREIFEKYNQAMPKVQCNQATNRNLKTICKAAGITELITRTETIGGKRTEVTYHKYELVSSHTARRSFATNAYKSGMPTLSIMKLTGHRTETSFMKYIRIGKEENAEILSNYEFLNDNDMTDVESSKRMGKELEVLEKKHNEIEDIINSSIDPVCAILNMTDMQEVIEVNVNNVDELTWWLSISASCCIECNKNINNHDFIQKLKRMLLEYCMETSIYEYVKDNQYGKISLFDGFAYLNVFYLKRVMPSNDEVINGEKNYRDIYQYFEDNKSCTLMQHEAYPFIEISDPKSSLLDKSKYENFYKKVFDSKDDNLDNNSIANQLKLIYESIVKVETTSPTQNKWKSLLLTYTSKEIMINTNVVTETSPKEVEETIRNVVKETIPKIVGETVQNVVRETAPKLIEEVAPKVVEETKIKSQNGSFNIAEQILYFYYLTGYSDDDLEKLKKDAILFLRINVNSIDVPLDRIKNFIENNMSVSQLVQYKPSLVKVKKYLSSQLEEKTLQSIKDKIQTVIDKVGNDIIKCDKRIETIKIEEEKAKKEKRKKLRDKTYVKSEIN